MSVAASSPAWLTRSWGVLVGGINEGERGAYGAGEEVSLGLG